MLLDIFTLVSWWRTSVVLEKKIVYPSFKEGELWWCSIGINVGVEIFGKGPDAVRPVVIFKKINAESFLGIPLTTKPKTGVQYVRTTHGGKERWAILTQARVFDAKRLMKPMGTFSVRNLQSIKDGFLALYGS